MRRCYIVTEFGCRLWEGATWGKGYAKARVNGVLCTLHRKIYERIHGKLPSDVSLINLCGHRNCLTPAHWMPVPMSTARRLAAEKRHAMEKAK